MITTNTNPFAYALNYDREIKQDEKDIAFWTMVVAFVSGLPKDVTDILEPKASGKLDPTNVVRAFLQTGRNEAQTAEAMGLTVEELRILCESTEIEGIADSCYGTPAYKAIEAAAMAKLGWMFEVGYFTLKGAKRERSKALAARSRHNRNKAKFG